MTTRRAVLAGVACLPVTVLPATEPDPIFALIEAHSSLCYEISTGASRDADYHQLDAMCEVLIDRQKQLLATLPTTLAGIRALADYALCEEMDLENHAQAILENIVSAVDQGIKRGV